MGQFSEGRNPGAEPGGIIQSVLRVPLLHGGEATVDLDDAPVVSDFAWTRLKTRGREYAYARVPGKSNVYMHRLIMDAGENEEVDHRDGNGLNNVRSNLRLATHALNLANQAPQKRPMTSRFKGVCRCRSKKVCWFAYIKVNGKRSYLGHFDVEEDAARAYDDAALKAWGEFARLNLASLVCTPMVRKCARGRGIPKTPPVPSPSTTQVPGSVPPGGTS